MCGEAHRLEAKRPSSARSIRQDTVSCSHLTAPFSDALHASRQHAVPDELRNYQPRSSVNTKRHLDHDVPANRRFCQGKCIAWLPVSVGAIYPFNQAPVTLPQW